MASDGVISLGAELYRLQGIEGLRGLFSNEQIAAWRRAEEEMSEIHRNMRAVPKADQEFAEKVIDWINGQEGDDRVLVVVPGPKNGYCEWLMRAVAALTEPQTIRGASGHMEYPEGMRVDFVSGQSIDNGHFRGRIYDKIFLHDDVTWRTYESVMPCLRRS